jgi:hypothetical protein
MTEQNLDDADVFLLFEQVSCERMAIMPSAELET